MRSRKHSNWLIKILKYTAARQRSKNSLIAIRNVQMIKSLSPPTCMVFQALAKPRQPWQYQQISNALKRITLIVQL